jgi:hypothetical protein
MFERDIHVIKAAQMAEMITGEVYPPAFTKRQLIQLMIANNLKAYSGMDFGFSHNFACVTGMADGRRLFIVDVIAEAEASPSRQIVLCQAGIKYLNPDIYADPENPQMVKVLRKAGFRMRDWKKGPGSIIGGIDAVRMKLAPAVGEPQLFFLADDEMVEFLAHRIERYHFTTDGAGRLTDEPDDKEDDEADSLRYLVMNVFGVKSKIAGGSLKAAMAPAPAQPQGYTLQNWARKIIDERVGENPETDTVGSAGKVRWSF